MLIRRLASHRLSLFSTQPVAAMTMNIMNVDIDIHENDIESSACKLMETVQPQWNVGDIKLKTFTEGITNKLFGCYLSGPSDMVLVRVYGEKTDLIIDRTKEKQNMMILHQAGLCPVLHCSFNNGICYGYVDGVTLNATTVCLPHIQRLVAKRMVEMHSIPFKAIETIRGDNNNAELESSYPRRVRQFIDIIPTEFDDPIKQQKLETQVPRKEDLVKELNVLLDHLDQIRSSVVFSHNDILCKNVIYSEEADLVTFIDYEYGDYNYFIYDIGNHFCEYAGVEEVDYSRYPDKRSQRRFIQYYLEFWYEKHHPGREVTEDDLERAYCIANKYALAAHMMWGLWALIQAKHSSIDFDYLSYAVERLNEYFAKRDQFFALPILN